LSITRCGVLPMANRHRSVAFVTVVVVVAYKTEHVRLGRSVACGRWRWQKVVKRATTGE